MLSLLISAIAAQRNLIANGGFEDYGTRACGTTWCISNDSTSKFIAPWYVVTPNREYELDPTSTWAAKEGSWSMDLNPNEPATIAQDVTLIKGNSYNLTFWVKSNHKCGSALKTGTVTITGVPPMNFDHQTGSDWKRVSAVFNATAVQSRITVSGTSPSGCGIVVDSFSLVNAYKCLK